MVGVTNVLARIPAIKFRKGGLGGARSPSAPSAPAAAAAGAASSGAAPSQQAAPMSTGSISDTEIPARYRRQPPSDEEIEYINGGGIV